MRLRTPIARTPILPLIALATALAACGGGTSEDAPPTDATGRVGLIVPNAGDADAAAFQRLLRRALQERDREIAVQQSGPDPAQQAALLERMAADRPVAIVVAPTDSLRLVPAIQAAARGGVPVFTLDMPATKSGAITHVGPDWYTAGVVAAEYINAFVGDSARTAIVGRLGGHGGLEMDAGFRATMRGRTDRVFVGAFEGGSTRESAAAAAREVIARDPGLDAFFALSADAALGAMDAALAARRADIVVVGYGGGPEVFEAIGMLNPLRATLVPQTAAGAERLAELIAKQLAGEPVTPTYRVPLRLVTADSVRGAAPAPAPAAAPGADTTKAP